MKQGAASMFVPRMDAIGSTSTTFVCNDLSPPCLWQLQQQFLISTKLLSARLHLRLLVFFRPGQREPPSLEVWRKGLEGESEMANCKGVEPTIRLFLERRNWGRYRTCARRCRPRDVSARN